MQEKKMENKEKGQKVTLKHAHFENLINYQQYSTPGFQAVLKIRSSIKNPDTRMGLYRYMKGITESAEFKAFFERKEELIKEFDIAQEALPKEEQKPKLPANMPGFIDLINMDALEITKFQISNKLLGPDITEFDLAVTDWLFEFVE
jgi:hypothetical protein